MNYKLLKKYSIVLFSTAFLFGCIKNVDYRNSEETEKESVYSKDEYSGLFTPENVSFRTDTKTFSWGEVKGATYYDVLIQSNGLSAYSKSNIKNTSIDLSSYKDGGVTVFEKFFEDNTNQVLLSVRARSDKDTSDYSSYLFDFSSHSDSLIFNYSLNEDKESVSITGFSGYATSDDKTNLSFPNQIAGLTVSEIASNAFVSSKNSIQKITLSSSIVKINDNAFSSEKTASYQSSITSVVFEDASTSKLEYIGSYAFSSLAKLTSVTIPNSVKTISDNAFYKCSKLSTLNINYEESNLEYVGNNAFDTCRELSYFGFSKYLKYIGKNAFSTCPKLSSVYFDKDIEIENIGEYAFASSGLNSFYLPKSVKSIDNNAFSGCTSLVAFFYDNDTSLEIIDNEAFNGCTSFKIFSSVDYENNNLHINTGEKTISKSFESNVNRDIISKITIGLSNKESFFKLNDEIIGEALSKFYINLPDSVRYLGNNVFVKNKLITNFKVSLNSNLTHIGDECFSNNEKLNSFVIPSKLEYLGKKAFENDSNLDIFNEFNTNAPLSLKYVAFDSFASTKNAPSTGKTYVINNTLISVEDKYKESNFNLVIKNINESETANSKKSCSVYYVGPSVFKSSKIASVDLDGVIGVYDESFASIASLKNLTLPASLTYIDEKAFYGLKNINTFSFECNNLTYIGNSAFSNLSSSNSIDINISAPDTLEYIGDNAFEEVKNLKSFNVNNSSSLSYIGSKAFYNCSNLTSFNVSNLVKTIGESAFESKSKSSLSNVNFDNASSLEDIGTSAFKNTSLTGTINISDKIEIIYSNTFASIKSDGFEVYFNETSNIKIIQSNAFDSSSLTKINIPSSLDTLEQSSFIDCKKLEEISFNNNIIDTIESDTFSGCISLATITLPDSVDTILDNAFDSCTCLTTINSKANNISKKAFNNSLFETGFDDGFVVYNNVLMRYTGSDVELDLSSTSIEIINPQAFMNSYSLKTVKLPSTLKVIGKEAFSNCSNLESVLFDTNNVERIDEYAFYNCSKLKTFSFSDTIESIGNYAFYNDSINNVYVGTNLLSIGDYAFYNNLVSNIEYAPITSINLFGSYSFAYNNLKSISFPEQDIKLNSYAFAYSYKVVELVMESNVTASGYSFYNSNSIVTLTADSNKPITVIFGGNASVVPQSLKTVNIVTDGNYICDNCFAGCGTIETINIPSTITKIGSYAFYGCRSITTLNIDNVETIGDYAFAGTTSLTLTNSNLTKASVIGDYVFLSSSAIDDFNNEFVIINGNLIKVNSTKTEIAFDKNSTLNVICGGAFAGNEYLETLSIDNNVTIHSGAFDNCYNFTTLKLNYINESDLNSIVNIELNVFDGTNDLKIVVPSKLKDAYKKDIYWKLYADKIK